MVTVRNRWSWFGEQLTKKLWLLSAEYRFLTYLPVAFILEYAVKLGTMSVSNICDYAHPMTLTDASVSSSSASTPRIACATAHNSSSYKSASCHSKLIQSPDIHLHPRPFSFARCLGPTCGAPCRLGLSADSRYGDGVSFRIEVGILGRTCVTQGAPEARFGFGLGLATLIGMQLDLISRSVYILF